MNLSLRSISVLLLLAFCIFLGFTYRVRQYKTVPKVNANFDELQYLWLGKSLLYSGVPASWSGHYIYKGSQFDGYDASGHQVSLENYNLTFDGLKPSVFNWRQFPSPLAIDSEASLDGYKSQFRIVQPNLDNPPLAGIILAAFDQGTTALSSTIASIRLVPIVLLSVTVGIILLLGLSISNLKAGLISALIYAVGPGYVVSSRMAVPENILAAVFPISLLILLFYLRSPGTIKFVLLLALSFFSPLLKISGVIIPLTLMAVLVYQKNNQKAMLIFFSMVLGILAYIAYGLFFQPNLFLQILLLHSERNFLGPLGVIVKIIYPEIPMPIFEGWIIIGYLSLFILAWLKLHKFDHLIVFGIISYLLFFAVFGGENYPWYQFIVFPLLALAAGIVIEYFINRPQLIFNLSFFLITLSSMVHYSRYRFLYLTDLNSYRLLVLIFVLIPILLYLLRRKYDYLLRTTLIIMLVLSFWLSTKVVNNMQALSPYLETMQYPLGQAYCCNGLP